jgi:hypothetical protein
MKNTLTLIAFTCLFKYTCAQTRADYPVKEHYEKLHYGAKAPDVADGEIFGGYGDNYSFRLESMIRMYETTGDKAYLITFVINAIEMQERRKDKLGVTTKPVWAYKESVADFNNDNVNPNMYLDGLTIWPMAHFMDKVYRENRTELFNLAIPQIPNSKIVSNSFGITFTTFGQFAIWLGARAEETLIFYTYDTPQNNNTNFWGDNTRCYTNKPDDDGTQILNQQAGFGAALFYLGLANPNQDYLDKAGYIGTAYKGNYTSTSSCPIFLGTPIILTPVFQTLANNSYVWPGTGWQPLRCGSCNAGTLAQSLSSIQAYTDYEDISHARQSLLYPFAINNKLSVNGTSLFNDYDMIKFRNTFALNIYAGVDNASCPQFHVAVDGDDYSKAGDCAEEFSGLNSKKQLALSYMPLYKYDSYKTEGNDVYDIVMNYYNCDIANDVVKQKDGVVILGLAETVAAQWDKECVNVTMYNRDVTYNQDFNLKNILTIAPQDYSTPYYALGDAPYAEPTVFTDGGTIDRFVIEPNTTVNMQAGERITFKAGFKASANCTFKASIVPSTCTDGARLAKPSTTPPKQDVLVNITLPLPTTKVATINEVNATAVTTTIKLYPNPTTSAISITGLAQGNYSYQLINAQGAITKQGVVMENNAYVEFESLIVNGLYALLLQQNITGNTQRLNIILQR